MKWRPSPAVLAKADRYLAEKRVSAGNSPGLWWVKGSRPRPYRVYTDASPTRLKAQILICSCPSGLNTEGLATCAHAAAVVQALIKESK